MQSDCLRLLVADDLRLGQPVRTCLPLTDEARDRVIDSTYQAWQQIQSLAVDREVNIVVLNGETLAIGDFSAEAEQALREGFAFLLEAGVKLVLHPGSDEHRAFWREFLSADADLRNSVSLLSGTIPMPLEFPPEEDERAEDSFGGKFSCRLVSIQDHILPDRDHPSEVTDHEQAAWTIGVRTASQSTNALPPGIDLLIAGGSAYWTCSHDRSLRQCLCAAPQALSEAEANSELEQGCLLIEVDGSGEVRAEQRPTASVRFLECELDLSSSRDWDDAALLLQTQIESLPWEDLERVRLIAWSLTAADPLSRQLLDGSGVDPLVAAWNRSFPLEDDLQVIHAFQAAGQFPHQWIHSQAGSETKELAEALFQQELTGETPRLDRLREDWPPGEPSAQLWTRLNPHLRQTQISRYSEALMSHWLKTSDPENLPYENHIS